MYTCVDVQRQIGEKFDVKMKKRCIAVIKSVRNIRSFINVEACKRVAK